MNKIDTHISLKVFQAIDVTVLKVIFKMCLVHIICMPYIASSWVLLVNYGEKASQ